MFKVDKDEHKSIWNPVIMFWNLKKYQQTKIYGDDTKSFLYYEANHSMWYGEGFQLTYSCHFNLQKFPHDSNECRMEYGEYDYGANNVILNNAKIVYGDRKTKHEADSPILIDDLPYPFEFEIKSIPTFNRTIGEYNYSFTGMLLKMKRKSFRKLISGFYYPTASFALLSMISFLIKPDVVRQNIVYICSIIYS